MTDSASKERADSAALQEVGATMKHGGQQISDEARSAAHRMACDQRDVLADYVAALADAAGRGAEDLRASGYGRSADTVKRTADEVGAFAARLQRREPGELWGDVEDFARDHPALAFGAGFALAFGVTRFLKNPAETRTDGGRGDNGRGRN